MVQYIKLKFKTVKSPEIIIYSRGRFKEFNLTYKSCLNSPSKSELASSNSMISEAIEVLTISIEDYLFSYNEYDGFTYGVFLSIIDSIIKELKILDNAILSEISIGIHHTNSYDSHKLINSLISLFNGKYTSVTTNMSKDKILYNIYSFSKIHIKLNTYELKKQ